jgi:hypothetical protein
MTIRGRNGAATPLPSAKSDYSPVMWRGDFDWAPAGSASLEGPNAEFLATFTSSMPARYRVLFDQRAISRHAAVALRRAGRPAYRQGARVDRRRRRARRPDDRHQALRGRRPGRPLLARPGEAVALGVRAGGHQRERQHQGRGRLAAGAPRRDRLRRRLPRQPAPREGHGRRGAGHRLHARPHGGPLQPHPEGLLDFRRFGGTLFHRTAFAGATTGQQLLYALDEQVRRFETVDVEDDKGERVPGEKMVRKFEFWDFLALVLDDDGVCRGIVAQDLKSMAIRAFPGDAVCLATGGPASSSALDQQRHQHRHGGERRLPAGRLLRERRVHPGPPDRHPRRRQAPPHLGERARRRGRVWVPKDPKEQRPGRDVPESDRDYFLEEKYPGYGNLVPRDIASRELFKKCFHEKRGIFNAKSGKNENEVYLDVTHLPRRCCGRSSRGARDLREVRRRGPVREPDAVFPAVHYSMGGLWVDFERRRAARS